MDEMECKLESEILGSKREEKLLNDPSLVFRSLHDSLSSSSPSLSSHTHIYPKGNLETAAPNAHVNPWHSQHHLG